VSDARTAVLPAAQPPVAPARGAETLGNYQNFAQAFKVREFRALRGSQKANHVRLTSAVEFGRAEMSQGLELYASTSRLCQGELS
jgi:putative DNA methylase